MGLGLEAYNDKGELTYSSEWGHARVLGYIEVAEGSTGQYKVVSPDGSPIQRLFAYTVPFGIPYVYLRSASNLIWTKGDTIYWKNIGAKKIIFGDGYK